MTFAATLAQNTGTPKNVFAAKPHYDNMTLLKSSNAVKDIPVSVWKPRHFVTFLVGSAI